jgi:tetratricopeptide (TPR) repeat protein
MRFLLSLVALVVVLVTGRPGHAQVDANAVDALDALRRGVALRKQGEFAKAVVLLTESFRLDPNVKALLNLADCEEHVDRLLDAEQHWIQARDLAEGQGQAAIRDEAVARLDALEPRIPRLAILLAPGAPSSSHVRRDDVEVPAGLLSVALPVDPGRHLVEVWADGRDKAVIEVVLVEREARRVEVEPGLALPPQGSPPSTPTDPPPPPVLPTADAPGTPAEPSRGEGPLFYGGAGAVALGLAGLAVGTVTAILAQGEHRDALEDCGADCASSPAAQALQKQARTVATLSTTSFVAGSVLMASGGVAVTVACVRANRSAPPGPLPAASVTPVVGANLAGALLELRW